MEICTAAGYRILTDPESGHRLRRAALRLMRNYQEEGLFDFLVLRGISLPKLMLIHSRMNEREKHILELKTKNTPE